MHLSGTSVLAWAPTCHDPTSFSNKASRIKNWATRKNLVRNQRVEETCGVQQVLAKPQHSLFLCSSISFSSLLCLHFSPSLLLSFSLSRSLSFSLSLSSLFFSLLNSSHFSSCLSLISFSLLFDTSSLFLFSLTMIVITGSVSSLCGHSCGLPCLSERGSRGPVLVGRICSHHAKNVSRCASLVPLSVKCACTCAGDG